MIFVVLAWRLWMIVSIVLIFNMISRIIFADKKTRVRDIFKSLFFVVFWPLSIFSPEGRDYIFGNVITKL